MSKQTMPVVNDDGFSPYDVAVRVDSIRGVARPCDLIIDDVRQAFREGRAHHVGTYGELAEERRMIEKLLRQTFPTSTIYCEVDASYSRGLRIVVKFPV